MTTLTLPESKLTKKQTKEKTVFYREGDTEYRMKITLRYDDECGNGHNTFAITSWIDERRNGGRWREYGGGANHDEIVKRAPEFAPLIRWHLTSSDGPMHYVGNALYHASDRDCWGKRKGEEKDFETRVYFDNVPAAFPLKQDFARWLEKLPIDMGSIPPVKELPYVPRDGEIYKFSPKYTLEGFGEKWYQGPFDSKREADEFRLALHNCRVVFKKVCVGWGEGKTPDLDAARNAACWPDAQLEDFTKEKLEARLPALMAEFKTAMEGLGFTY